MVEEDVNSGVSVYWQPWKTLFMVRKGNTIDIRVQMLDSTF